MSDVLVVGCGLLGTSIGLALRGSAKGDVTLWDASDAALVEAAERGAG
jgi:prephenate dehydrogenase